MIKSKKPLPCPVCGRKPRVWIYPDGTGSILCEKRWRRKKGIDHLLHTFDHAQEPFEETLERWNAMVIQVIQRNQGENKCQNRH